MPSQLFHTFALTLVLVYIVRPLPPPSVISLRDPRRSRQAHVGLFYSSPNPIVNISSSRGNLVKELDISAAAPLPVPHSPPCSQLFSQCFTNSDLKRLDLSYHPDRISSSLNRGLGSTTPVGTGPVEGWRLVRFDPARALHFRFWNRRLRRSSCFLRQGTVFPASLWARRGSFKRRNGGEIAGEVVGAGGGALSEPPADGGDGLGGERTEV